MARYRKISVRVWNDAKFASMSDDGKLAFFFVLTHPHMTSLGAMRSTVQGLAAELGWSHERLSKAFSEAINKGVLKVDEKAKCVFLPNFIKHNQPESPNVIKAWGKAVDEIPECELKAQAIQHATDHAKSMSEGFKKACESLGEAFAKSIANQEQEQEQEPEQEENNSPPADAAEQLSRSDHESNFEILWQSFDKTLGEKGSKKNAQSQYLKLKPDHDLFQSMLSALQDQIANKHEKTALGQFAPSFKHVERWLKDRRWEDEISPADTQHNPARLSKSDRDDEAMFRYLREHGLTDDDGEGVEAPAILEADSLGNRQH